METEEKFLNIKMFCRVWQFFKSSHFKSIYSNELLVKTKTEKEKQKEGELGMILSEE